MPLSGLLATAAGDPVLTAATDLDAPRRTLSGPAAIQPLAVASAAAAGRVVFAVTSGGREADDLAEALQSLLPPDRVAVYPGWETLPHERLSPRRRHRRAAAGGAAPPGPPGRRRPGRRAAVGGGRARCARCCSRRCPASANWSRSRCTPATPAGSSPASSPPSSTPATAAPNWSRSGATSPSAAGSWTSSRPPRSTRCGWSSGATTSRRSATSRSPTSARSRSPSTGCGRRRAASCC